MIKMPLPNLNLDDKTFKELVEDAKKYIPIHAPDWTDYNIHDPGITLIELFAWISEMQLYYLSKITEENKLSFLKILGAPIKKDEKLDDAISEARKDIGKIYSAITPDDYEYLVYEFLEAYEYLENEHSDKLRKKQLKDRFRVKAIPDLENQLMNVIIVDKYNIDNNHSSLYDDVYSKLDECRLVGTPLYVKGPEFVEVSVFANISVKKGYNIEIIENKAENNLKKFLDPIEGGILKKGWPFGRSVFKSEIYKILTMVDGVKSVQNVEIYGSNKDYRYDELSIPDNGLVHSNEIIISVNSNSYCKKVDYDE